MNEYVKNIYDNPELVQYSVDICEHKEYLKNIAEGLVVVELGVRNAFSSCCFLMSCKKLISYDTYETEYTKKLEQSCEEWSFNIGNSLEIEIPDCDVLFLDTEHNYTQLLGELNLHHKKCKKYIVMHDTNMDFLKSAIRDFLRYNVNWRIAEVFSHNNGITTLERLY